MANKRVRLYDDEAKLLGLKLKRHDVGRTTARYRITPDQQKQLAESRSYKNIKRLFYDIETSQYEGRFFHLGDQRISYDNVTKDAQIICVSWKWEGEDKVHNLDWGKGMSDERIVKKFIPVLNKADEIVAHNGDRFDIRWIRTRALKHGVKMRSKYRSLDTLKKARTHFRFPNNRLDTIAKYLGVGAKYAHEGLKMWHKCQDGSKKALKEMVHYCDIDVVVLEDVYKAMRLHITQNTHTGVLQGGYKHECPACGGEHATLLKNNFTAQGTIKRLMECDTCEYEYEISNSAYRFMTEMKDLI